MSLPTFASVCAAVNDALSRESGRLTDGMFERAALARPIIRLQSKTRTSFKLGAGISQSSVRFERSLPDTFTPASGDPAAATSDPWGLGGNNSNLAASANGDGAGCLPGTNTVSFGQTHFTITPKHAAINTQTFCIRDIITGFMFADWMRKVSKALEYIPTWFWARRYTADYVRVVALANQMVSLVSGSTPTMSNTYSTSTNGKLRQGILDSLYAHLMRNGASQPSGVDEATGAPVFTLITSAETSIDIIRSDPDLRNDTRYAFMGKGEMTPLVPGVPFKKKNYGGFIHEIDPYPRRFTIAGGAFLEINPFIQSTTTTGNKWEVNAAWENAPFEESIIWHEGVYRSQVVNTSENIPDGWNFTPRSYMGSFSPRNILDAVCNPDGTMIFFRGLFSDAAEPMDPTLGYSIIHNRCAPDSVVRSCYVS